MKTNDELIPSAPTLANTMLGAVFVVLFLFESCQTSRIHYPKYDDFDKFNDKTFYVHFVGSFGGNGRMLEKQAQIKIYKDSLTYHWISQRNNPFPKNHYRFLRKYVDGDKQNTLIKFEESSIFDNGTGLIIGKYTCHFIGVSDFSNEIVTMRIFSK